ncbi:MAG TPA: hypothetical protein VHX44_02350, partial [Planctomycetota bacterium]|nr:hypothetical protein [Planctomycetota bacterium]
MPITTVFVVIGTLLAVDADATAHATLTSCCDPGTPVLSSAIIGRWLTLGAMLATTVFHLLRTQTICEWIAERRSA